MPGSSPAQRLRSILHPPLWARWTITIVAFAVGITVVIVVNDSAGGSSTPSRSEAAAQAAANREGEIAIKQDEAPHEAPLSPAAATGAAAGGALERAIAADVRHRVQHGELTGPLQSVRCKSSAAARSDRTPFSCEVRSAGIDYEFVGVADARTARLTWCKVDPPTTTGESLEVPVSARCRA